MGLHRAWPDAEIIGVDIEPQPHYPFNFVLSDAMVYSLDGFDFIWASPPCQAYCALKTMPNSRVHAALIVPLRKRFSEVNTPWVIENVFGAPLLNPTMLCGSHFNLCADGFQLRRHRYFESNFLVENGHVCRHQSPTCGIYGGKVRDIAREKRHYSKPKESRGIPAGVVLPQRIGKQAMGIDWMSMKELSEAIPPAYSEYIARQWSAL